MFNSVLSEQTYMGGVSSDCERSWEGLCKQVCGTNRKSLFICMLAKGNNIMLLIV